MIYIFHGVPYDLLYRDRFNLHFQYSYFMLLYW